MGIDTRRDEILGNLEFRTNGYWCAETNLAGKPVSLGIGLSDPAEENLQEAILLARRIVEWCRVTDDHFRSAIADDLLSLYNEHYRLDDDPQLDIEGLKAPLQPKWVEIVTDPWDRLTARIIYSAEDLFDGRAIELWLSPDDLQADMVNLT